MSTEVCDAECGPTGSECELDADHEGPHMRFDFQGTFAWGLHR